MADLDFNHLKAWLTPLIEERQITVERLSKECGLSRAAIYAYLKDRNRPDDLNMAKICKALSEIPVWRDGKAVKVKVPLEEALKQYTPKRNGRPAGSGATSSLRAVTAR